MQCPDGPGVHALAAGRLPTSEQPAVLPDEHRRPLTLTHHLEGDVSPIVLGILLALAAFIGFLGLAIGGRFTQPAVIVAAVLAGVVLVVDLIAAHA